MKNNARKYLAAALGLTVGIITIPIAIIVFPAFAAWFFWNEMSDEEVEEE